MKVNSKFGVNTPHLINIAFFAGIFEWYEFSLYSLMGIYMGTLFFNQADQVTGILYVYTVYAFRYLARPLGALFFGKMGDISRGRALKFSLMTMAIPTIIIGCLPTYATVGPAVTVVLCTLQLIQGFGIGGEFPNSICYVLDTAPTRYRSLFGSITCASTSIGIALGSLVLMILQRYFDHAKMLRFGWRIPFLLGIPLALYIAWIRSTIIDADQPILVEKRSPKIWARLREEKYNLLKIILIGGTLSTLSNILLLWLPNYLQVFLSITPERASIANKVTLWFEITTLIATGYLTSFIPVEKTLKWLHVGLLLLIYPLFQLLSTHPEYLPIMIGTQLVCAFFLGSMNGCLIEMISRLLAYDIRSLGTSIIFAISPALLGGSAPVISTLLIKRTGLLAAPAFVIIVIGLAALPFTLSLKSTQPKNALTER